MKTKKVKLKVSASQLKNAFEPYKAWKMNPSNPKDVHWTHKELDEDEWDYSDRWHKKGVCERQMEFVYYALYTNGHDDRHDEIKVNFLNKHNLYSKVVNEVSKMIELYESQDDIQKIIYVSLVLPDGNNNWDWIDLYESN